MFNVYSKRVHSSCEPLSSRVNGREKSIGGQELFEGMKAGHRVKGDDSIPQTRGSIGEMLSGNISPNT